MKTTYISGKITGLDWNDVWAKFQKADELLKSIGYQTFNPTTHPHDNNGEWEEYMAEDIKHLLKCDAIYLLRDWQESKGARVEHAIAKELGLEIIVEGEWQIERTISKKIDNIDLYPDLAKAMELNNSVKSEAAYVYDRFQVADMDCTGMNSSAISEAFDRYISKLPPLDAKPDPSLFKLVPVDTFDSQEQIQWLISEGKFYYAPIA
jgi:hypothetical protein